MRQQGRKVPSVLKEHDWEHILGLKSMSARTKYYLYMFRNEMSDLNLKKKKENRMIEREARLAERRALDADKHIVYGLGNNSIFHMIYDTTVNMWNNNKLVQAMQFEPK